MKNNRRMAIAMAVLLLVVLALDCLLMPRLFHTHGASQGGIIALTYLPFMVFAVLAAETYERSDAWANFGYAIAFYIFIYGAMILPIVGAVMNQNSHYDYAPLMVASWIAGPVGYIVALMTAYIFAPSQSAQGANIAMLRKAS